MIELQRRLAQDYQRQREAELNRQMAETAVRDDDDHSAASGHPTVLVGRAGVNKVTDGLSPHQMSGGPVQG